jgi:hypothetical protein
MIDLDFDLITDDLTLGLDRTSRAVKTAIKRAVRKTLNALRTQILRQVSRDSGMTQKKLRQYQRVHISLRDNDGLLWVGLNPVPLHETGRVSWSRKRGGARVRGKTYAGSFYRPVYGSQPKVWIRSARNRQEGHPGYHPKRRRYSAAPGGLNRGRFPVELLGAPLEDSADKLDARIEQFARDRFRKHLAHELEYALEHERR